MSIEHDAENESPQPARSARIVIDFTALRKLGGQNFRDLGGHPTADGRWVRQKMIYRSAHMAQLPNGSPLKGVELKTLVTLQSRLEVNNLGPPHPDVLASARWRHIPMGDQLFEDEEFSAQFFNPRYGYLALVTGFRADWQSFFKLLAEPEVYPLLFHCSAGRDRTGVGAALLLEVLGVDRGEIVADFLESNSLVARVLERVDHLLKAEHLDPVFSEIDASGGIDRFMCEYLGLELSELAAVRDLLIEA